MFEVGEVFLALLEEKDQFFEETNQSWINFSKVTPRAEARSAT